MDDRNPPRAWLRLAGLGFELAGSIAGGALIGWWIDRRLGSAPKALITLSVIGIVGGLYNLIKTALGASKEARESDRSGQDEGKGA